MLDEPVTKEPWPAPYPTANSALLSGYIAGALSTKGDYKAVEIDAARGLMVVENLRTGNRFQVEIQQMSGRE